jgi:hypothetical protein
VDEPGEVEPHINPYMTTSEQAEAQGQSCSKEDAGNAAGSGFGRQRYQRAGMLGRQRPAHPVRAQSVAAQQVQAACATHRAASAQLRRGQERPDSVRPRQSRAAPGDQPRQRPRAGQAHGEGPRPAMCG